MCSILLKCILLCGLALFSFSINALQKDIHVDVNDIELTQAIRLIANFLHMNVIISKTVQGTTSLHLQSCDAQQVLNLLLTTHALAKWKMGNVFFIAPRDELIKLKEEETKWQQVSLASAPLLARFWRIKYGKATDIANMVQDEKLSLVSQRGIVKVDSRTNIIYVQDIAAKLAIINSLIKRLDVPIQQILIEARLASVDSDFERELGINFVAKNGNLDKDKGINESHESNKYSIAIAKLANGYLLDVKLSALENAGHAELISSPSLFTENQQTASIEAGEEVPYQEASESGGTAIVFKKAVLGLKVTPQVLPGKKVLLRLQINQDRPSNRMVLGVPTISTRQLMTQVVVRTGETVVLGGIFETDQENVQQRFPILSRIPLLGWLFAQENTRKTKRELLIFVTPKIII